MGRRGRKCKELHDDLKKTRWCWNFKGKHEIELYGELAVEEAMGLP